MSDKAKKILLSSIAAALFIVVAYLLYKKFYKKENISFGSANSSSRSNTTAAAAPATPTQDSAFNTRMVTNGTSAAGSTSAIATAASQPAAVTIDYSKYSNAIIQLLFPNGDKDRLINEYNANPKSKETFLDAYNVMFVQGEANRKNLPADVVNAWLQSHIDLENFFASNNKLTTNISDGTVINLNRLIPIYISQFVNVVNKRAEQTKNNNGITAAYVKYLNAALQVAVQILPLVL